MSDPMAIEDSWGRVEWTLSELIGGNTPESDPDWDDPIPEVYEIGAKWVKYLRALDPPFPEPAYIQPVPTGGITVGFCGREVGPGSVTKIEIDIENVGELDFSVFMVNGDILTFHIDRNSDPLIPCCDMFPYWDGGDNGRGDEQRSDAGRV